MSMSNGLRCVRYQGLCNNYREGEGVGKPEGGIGGNQDEREGGLDVKFYTFGGGGITFFIPFHKPEKG